MASALDSKRSEILHFGFNRDGSCAYVTTRRGFFVFTCAPRCELRLRDGLEGVKLTEMLYSTSLIATVGSGDTYGSSPRKLKLWNWTDEQSSVICELNFVSAILAVQINRERLVVCLEHNLHIFHVPDMVCLQTLSTPPNPTGLFALSREGASIIAMPSREKGEVVLYDAIALRLLSRLHAHKSNVTAMAFNPASTMIATASEQGTVVRVFSVPRGEHLCTFRRGSTPSRIYSLSFLDNPALLAVAASSGTIHVFSLQGVMEGRDKKPQRRNRLRSDSAPVVPGAAGAAAASSAPSSQGHGVGGDFEGSEALDQVSLQDYDSDGEDGFKYHASYPASDTSSQVGGFAGRVVGNVAQYAQYVQSLWNTGDGGSSSAAAAAGGGGSSSSSSGTSWVQQSLARSAEVVGEAVQAISQGVAGYLPRSMQEYADSNRSIAQARLPDANVKYSAILTQMYDEASGQMQTKLQAVTARGFFYRYDVPFPHEGDASMNCRLEEETVLDTTLPALDIDSMRAFSPADAAEEQKVLDVGDRDARSIDDV